MTAASTVGRRPVDGEHEAGSTRANEPAAAPVPVDAAVVVGVDDSPEGLAAARYGAAMAAAGRRPVLLVHALDLATTGIAPASAARRIGRTRAEQLLNRVGGHLAGVADLRLFTAVLSGPAERTLEELAAGAALVVVGQDHLVHDGRLAVGRLARRLSQAGPGPVAVVPAHWTPEAVDGRPVVVALTAEPPCRRLVDLAYAEAEAWAVGIRFRHAARNDAEAEQVRIALSEALAGDRASHADVAAQVDVVVGAADDMLPAWSAEATTLVVGRSGHWSEWRHGTVARTVDHAHCPVVVVPCGE